MNKLTTRLLAVAAVLALLMTIIAGCGDDKKEDKKKQKNSSSATTTTAKPVDLTDCTVTIVTEAGKKLEGIGVGVYADEQQEDIIDFARTDANGTVAFKSTISTGSYIFLTELPDGYAAEKYYRVANKDTLITLTTSLNSELSPITLGSVMFDFSVTDQNGTEHTLSKLLESKKAVVINLWFTTCGPCKLEFPYLQQAYNEYKDDIALLAISPMDNADAVSAFATENGLTFPMAACDPAWDGLISGIAYPTTVVVDRFGIVSLIHTGWIDNSKTFKNVFAYFAADDYESAPITDMSQFESAEDEDTLGTAANPYEYSGTTGFSVDVEPGQTVYYSLYGVDGLHLSVDSSSLKLVCNETEHLPSGGKIAFTIRSADATAPVLVQFTNTGKDKATYKVKLSSPAGAANNPITLKDGTTTIKLEEGNNRGVYYQYKAPYEGTFTLECKNTVNYTVTIKNLSSNKTATLNSSTKKASIDVRKNDKVQIVVIAVAKDGKYPAAEAKLNASFKKEEVPVTPPTGNSGDTPTLNTNGKLTNPDTPVEFAGANALDFSTDVKAGERVLIHLFRVSGTTLRISDASAYVVYLDKTYTPDKNGNVYVPLTSDGPSVPIILQIGNGGKENKTYTVKCSYPEGSMMNPYDAVDGNIKTQLAAGNDQGVYYTCTAEKDGKITVTLKSVTKNVKCDIRVTVVDSNFIPQQYLLTETNDGKTLTVDVYAGDEIEINVVALPDEKFKYPAATIEFSLTLP